MTDTVTFYQNPFYDYLFGTVGTIVPSKRTGYKTDPVTNVRVATIPKGVHEFEAYIKSWLAENPEPEFPLSERLLVIISVALTPKEYRQRDVDGFSKTMLDALKGIVYTDDKQVDALYAFKYKSNKNGFMVAIKKLSDNQGWFLPNLWSEEPFTQ